MTDLAPHIQEFIDAHLGDDVEIAVRGRTTAHKLLKDGRIKFTVSEILRDDGGNETGVGEIVGYFFGTPPPTKEEVAAMLVAQEEHEQALAAERLAVEVDPRVADLLELDRPDGAEQT